jgi:hypothetical protein
LALRLRVLQRLINITKWQEFGNPFFEKSSEIYSTP